MRHDSLRHQGTRQASVPPSAPTRSLASQTKPRPNPAHWLLLVQATAQMPPWSSMHTLPPGHWASLAQTNVHMPPG